MATNPYFTLPTMAQNQANARNQAKNVYDNAVKNIYDQRNDYYRQRNNLATDKYIQGQANHLYGDIKYGAGFDSLKNEENLANNNYSKNLMDFNTNYNRSIGSLRNSSFQEQQNSTASVFSRGLGNSSVLDNNLNRISAARISGETALEQDLNNNIAKIDMDLSATLQDVANRRTTMTNNQKAEIVNYINEKTKEREQERARLNMLIEQNKGDVSLEQKNYNQNYQNNLQEALKYYGGLARDDRSFAAQQKQQALDNAFRQQQLALQRYNAQTSRTKATTGSKSTAGKPITVGDPNKPGAKTPAKTSVTSTAPGKASVTAAAVSAFSPGLGAVVNMGSKIPVVNQGAQNLGKYIASYFK